MLSITTRSFERRTVASLLELCGRCSNARLPGTDRNDNEE